PPLFPRSHQLRLSTCPTGTWDSFCRLRSPRTNSWTCSSVSARSPESLSSPTRLLVSLGDSVLWRCRPNRKPKPPLRASMEPPLGGGLSRSTSLGIGGDD